jgi:hypothetical protein
MEIAKKYWKIIVALLLLLLILGASWFANWALKLKDQNAILHHKADSSFLVAKYFKNKHGELVNEVNTYELTTNDLKKLGSELGFNNKQLKDQVGSLTNLVSYWKGQASTHGGDTVRTHDTTYLWRGQVIAAKHFDWTDKYLTLDGDYFPSTDKFAFKYNYSPGGFELTSYRKKVGLFKPKQLVTDIKFGDPNMKVTNFQGLVIKEPRKKFWETKAFAFGLGVLGGSYLVLRYR